MSAYLGLFVSGFLAATLLPALSEVTLGSLVAQGLSIFPLWLVATLGNTLGSCVNWALGYYLRGFENHRRFPLKPAQVAKASQMFNRYGKWSLLFAWLPIIGDPLTFVAGAARLRFGWFLLLVAIGKGARYAAVIAIAQSIFSG
ncbi:MAG: YqaA family protein [Gammaproteobacteria bacterium]